MGIGGLVRKAALAGVVSAGLLGPWVAHPSGSSRGVLAVGATVVRSARLKTEVVAPLAENVRVRVAPCPKGDAGRAGAAAGSCDLEVALRGGAPNAPASVVVTVMADQ